MDESTASAFINMRNDVTNLQKDFARTEVVVSRFDNALDKMSEVSLNVSKLLAVHEQRIEAHDTALSHIVDTSEKRVEKYDGVINGLSDKLDEAETVLRKEMSDGQKEILSEIKSMRTDMVSMGDKLESKTDTVKTELEKDFGAKIDTVTNRVTKLERLSWIIMGGATVIGFLLSQAIGVLGFLH